MIEDDKTEYPLQSETTKGGLRRRLPFIMAGAIVIAVVFYWGWDLLILENVKASMEKFKDYVQIHYALSVAIYLMIYMALGVSFLPGATVLALLGGYLYGFVAGAIYVIVGLSLGALSGFYLARYSIGKKIQHHYKRPLQWFNKEISHYGHYFLFVFRLLPLLPFSLVNYFSGLTRMPFMTYIVVTILGELPGTILCTYAGRQLAMIESVDDVFTLSVIISFSLVAIIALLPVFFSIYRRLHHIS